MAGSALRVPDEDTKFRVKERMRVRYSALKTERSSWDSHWRDIACNLLPRAARFSTTDRNRDDSTAYNRIYDNTATRALTVLSSGMMAGATSPARPWFRLASPDPDLNAFHAVKLWLRDVEDRMQRVFQGSNTYRTLHQMYRELGAFGTSVSIVMPERDRVIHHYPVPIGEYALQQDYQGRISVLYREFEKTVGEVVDEFGIENCSIHVQQLFETRSLEAPVPILHVIEPRDDSERNLRRIDNRNIPRRSCSIELNDEIDTVLRESGFEHFPVLAPRWEVQGCDVYGQSPGMVTLGDVRQLQHQQLRKAQAIDYMTKPPLQMPTEFKDRLGEALGGGVNYPDPGSAWVGNHGGGPNAGMQTAFQVTLRLEHLTGDMAEVRERIRGGFFEDLFLMVSQLEGQKTAYEVAIRQEEKLVMLGPVLERLHDELLRPLVDMTFDYMVRAGQIPPAPPELQGIDLEVEFVSILAQAQRAVGMNNIDRFVSNIGAIGEWKPEVLDKFNVDAWVDMTQDVLGIPPELIVPDEEVAELRAARDRAAAAQEMVAAQREQAATARDLASADTSGKNALTDVAESLSGLSAAV